MTSRDLPRFDPGTQIGDYRIERWAGGGGFGDVYCARQVSLDRRVALKVLPWSGEPAELERLRREAILLGRVHHESLVDVYECGSDRGVVFIAMRWVEGPSLHDLLKEQRQSDERTAEQRIRWIVARVREVADALAAMHSRGLIHRDVKPSNVLVEAIEMEGGARRERAVLVDFGIARESTDSAPRTTTHAMTVEFAAPELLLRSRPMPTMDVFSLGVTLHDLLARRIPSEREPALSGMEPIEDLVPEIDEDLAAIVAMARDPEARYRYPHARAFFDDLSAWENGLPTQARSRRCRERLKRFLRTHRRVYVVSALVIGLAVFVAPNLAEQRVANAACRVGDLTTFVEVARRIDSGPLPLLLDTEVARFWDRLWPPSGNGLGRLVRSLEAGLGRDAAEIAVASLQRDRFLDDRFLFAFLEQRLADDAAWKEALHPIARLLIETPVETEAEELLFRRIESLLESRLQLPFDPLEDPLRGLVALSGCAGPDRLPWILAPERIDHRHLEQRRLAFHCAERVIRRANSSGRSGQIDFAVVEAALTGSADFIFSNEALTAKDEEQRRVWSETYATLMLAISSALAARRADIPLRVEPDLPDGLLQRLPECSANGWLAITMLAAKRDPRVHGWLMARLRDCSAIEEEWNIGRCAALLDDALVTKYCRDHSVSRSFEAGFDAGIRMLSGETLGFGIDPRFWISSDEMLPKIKVEVQPGDCRDRELCFVDLESDPSTAFGLLGAPELVDSIARSDESGSPCYVMGRPGKSAITLIFEFPDIAIPESPDLSIQGIAANRFEEYLIGTCHLNVTFDGTSLDTATMWESPEELVISLSDRQWTKGRHQIRIELDSRSTTSFRVGRIALKTTTKKKST